MKLMVLAILGVSSIVAALSIERGSGGVATPTPAVERVPLPIDARALTMFHAREVEVFVSADGFGLSRMLRQEAETHPLLTVGDAVYRVERHELIGLLGDGEPVAYVTVGFPSMRHFKPAETRRLSDFERGAIDALRRGEDMVAGGEGDSPLAVGALRARQDCVRCHDAEPGALLGAFTYRFAPAASPAAS